MPSLYLLLALAAGAPTDQPLVHGTERRATSANFDVVVLAVKQDARTIARQGEDWREKLLATWAPRAADRPWKVSCQIVVHASRQSYVAAVGRGGQTSLGSSLLNFSGTEVSQRRIDLLADERGELTALGHEMTHVVLADLFGGKQLPRWADEGMAILADGGTKRSLHQRDLAQGLQTRQAFHCGELMALGDYPPPARIPAFYGQSASVVACLCKLDKPERFVEFIQLAMWQGNDVALRSVYGLQDAGELERLWRADKTAAVQFHRFQLALAP